MPFATGGVTELLLLPGRRLEGPRQVGVTTRPLRTAYVVDAADRAIALAAIESACLEWGGAYNFLIPCGLGEAPSPMWLRILEKFDPDFIFDLIGASDDFLTDQNHRAGRAVRRWESPLETMDLVGSSVYGPITEWKRRWVEGESWAAPNLNPLKDHPLALPLAFRFGHVDLRPMSERSLWFHPYTMLAAKGFLPTKDVGIEKLSEDDLRKAIVDVPVSPSRVSLFPEINRYTTLPEITKLNAAASEPGYSMGGTPEREQHDEAYYRAVIVVGPPDSVADLCLAWNLRAQRFRTAGFPIWMDPVWLEDQSLVSLVTGGLLYEQPGLAERDDARKVHLISASLPVSELQALVARLPLDAVPHPSEEGDLFFSGEFRVGRRSELVVNFQGGSASIPAPDYSPFGDFYWMERIGWSVDIQGVDMPVGSWRHFFRLGVMSRLATDGIGGWVGAVVNKPGALLDIGTTDGWDVVGGIGAQAGYVAQVSDKGQHGVALLRLLNEPRALQVLGSSRVYELLENMSEIVPRRAVQARLRDVLGAAQEPEQLEQVIQALQEHLGEGQFERQHLSLEAIRQRFEVSADVCAVIVNWLVQREILLRGYQIRCPHCGVARWYPLERLARVHHCDLCLEDSPITVPADRLDWSYRINELVARAVDQGVLPHVLACRTFVSWGQSVDSSLLGFLPGVSFRPRDGGAGEIEVDLLAVMGGRAIVGECKASGFLEEREVERLAGFARSLNCSRLIYASPKSFDGSADLLERATQLTPEIQVEVWDGEALFDAGLEEVSAQERPKQGLERLARMLSDQSRYPAWTHPLSRQ